MVGYGCISGALREDEFLAAFERAGFHGVEVASWSDEPWRTVEGIQFRSVTVTAWKGKQGDCWDCNQAVLYKGPYKSVLDDDGHTYPRGQRIAVCAKTFELLKAGPYAEQFVFLEPRIPVALEDAEPFPCAPPAHAATAASGWEAREAQVLKRDPRQSKGVDYELTADGTCSTESCC